MTDFPRTPVPPLFVHSFSLYSIGSELRTSSGSLSLASTDWPANNTAIYLPFAIPWHYPVNRVWWVNGSTAGGNTDIGIYNADGVRLYSSGSVACSGASAPQYVTPGTPLLLSPGRYYFARAHSITTALHVFASTIPSLVAMRMCGVFYEASALPLPATMTGAAPSGNRRIPLIGITQTTTGF